MKVKTAIIGGTGLYELGKLNRTEVVDTQYGSVEVALIDIGLYDSDVAFLCRHGSSHQTPPHAINYRANIKALKNLGVEQVIATNAVGGIFPHSAPGMFTIPHQLIDYTFGREHTFFDDFSSSLTHVDFTEPYSSSLRESLISALKLLGYPSEFEGVYGCVQGPRLETAAEVIRYRSDGCNVLGMTGMPEAALARELNIDYASLCFSVNWAAGTSGQELSIEKIIEQVKRCSSKLHTILNVVAQNISN